MDESFSLILSRFSALNVEKRHHWVLYFRRGKNTLSKHNLELFGKKFNQKVGWAVVLKQNYFK